MTANWEGDTIADTRSPTEVDIEPLTDDGHHARMQATQDPGGDSQVRANEGNARQCGRVLRWKQESSEAVQGVAVAETRVFPSRCALSRPDAWYKDVAHAVALHLVPWVSVDCLRY